jgi:hypothetical protein
MHDIGVLCVSGRFMNDMKLDLCAAEDLLIEVIFKLVRTCYAVVCLLTLSKSSVVLDE